MCTWKQGFFFFLAGQESRECLFLFLTSGLAVFICLWHCQIQVTRLFMFFLLPCSECYWGSFSPALPRAAPSPGRISPRPSPPTTANFKTLTKILGRDDFLWHFVFNVTVLAKQKFNFSCLLIFFLFE